VLPLFQPVLLVRRLEPFSDPQWLNEIKYDSFRALCYVDPSGERLISRNGNRFSSFTELCAGIGFSLKARHAVLDGEIAVLDKDGFSQFNQWAGLRQISV
jgi:bifunctional non-homologous end joining protein LigD